MEKWLWDLVPWGYEVLLRIETWRTPLLDTFFASITELGGEWFYILVFPLIYWCLDKQLSVRTTMLYLSSAYLNYGLKDYFGIPRPVSTQLDGVLDRAGVSARLDPLLEAEDPSWPSGHTQGAVVFWGYLAQQVNRRWFWILAALTAALIAFSRMYGGVHFPQDVIGGLAVGLVYLIAWLLVAPAAQTYLAQWPLAAQLGLALGIPLLALILLPRYSIGMVVGASAGAMVGHLVQERLVKFEPAGPWVQRVLRAVLGLILVLAVYLGLSQLFDLLTGGSQVVALRTLRYGMVGLTATWFAPWLFVRIGLAGRTQPAPLGPISS